MTRLSRAVVLWLLTATALTSAALWAREQRPTGALLTLTAPGVPPISAPRRVSAIDLRDVHAADSSLAGIRSARWSAYWQVRDAGPHRLVADTDGAFTVTVDGVPVVAAQGGRARSDVMLQPGLRRLEASYESPHDVRWLRLHWVDPAGGRHRLAGANLFTAVPSARQLRWAARSRVLLAAAALAWLLPIFLLAGRAAAHHMSGARFSAGQWPASWKGRGPALRRTLAVAVPAAVFLLGGALRFEALVARYGWQGPAWTLSAERALAALHPAALVWEPEPEHQGGDPYHYYLRAREMRGFYEAHVREPVFPFATRALIPLVGDRPFAANAASAVFSALAVLAAYLLGATAFSRGVGLFAALGLALHREVVWWGVEGFRDDAFMAFVLLFTAALLRLQRRPTLALAVLVAACGALACLTRITALAFLLPALVWVAVPGGVGARERRRFSCLAGGLLLTAVAPFLLACALSFGDPFHSVNAHTRFYRARGGLPSETPASWAGYLVSAFAPAELAETGLRGLTTEPLRGKWRGLDYLSPWLRRVLAPLAVIGLALFLGSREGRLLLVILLGCLLPYAFTWRVPGGAEWRFTMPAYPFYLIAAAAAVLQGLRIIGAQRRRQGAAS